MNTKTKEFFCEFVEELAEGIRDQILEALPDGVIDMIADVRSLENRVSRLENLHRSNDPHWW